MRRMGRTECQQLCRWQPHSQHKSHHTHASHYHPNIPKPTIGTLSSLAGDADSNATQYVGHVPMQPTCSGLVCRLGGAGASLPLGAFEELVQDSVPTPSTPNPWTIWDALDMPDANERRAAMEIENMGRLIVLKTVPRLPNTNIITP